MEKTKKTKITLDIQRKIQEVNNRLPPMGKYAGGQPVYKWVEVSGEELRPEDVKAGTVIHSEGLYRVRRLVYEKHALNMIHLVQKSGEGAIADYESAVMAQYRSFQKADREARSLKNKFINYFQKLWKTKK